MISRLPLFLLLAVACFLFQPSSAFAQEMSKEEVKRQLDRALDLATAAKYAEAAAIYEKILPSSERIYGKEGADTATIYNDLAFLYTLISQHTKAEPLFQRSLQIREAKLGKDHIDVAQSLNELAGLYHVLGQYAKAEPLFQRSLQILEAKLGKDHPSVARPLNGLGLLYSDTGQYAKAEPLYQRSLRIREAKLGKDDRDVASSLHHLALLYRDLGQYAKAEPLFQRSLQIYEAKLGKDHPSVAISLTQLAGLYLGMGQYAKAESLYQRSLQIFEAKLGKDDREVAPSLNNLAVLYMYTGQYTKAEPLYLRSLQISEAKLGKDHPNVASSLNNLALLYRKMRQYTKAEPLYQRSLQILEAKLGKDHPTVATSLHNQADLYHVLGQYAKAEPLFQRSLQIYEVTLGTDHPSVAASLGSLAWNSAFQKEWTNAANHLQKARRAITNHIAEVLPVLSEKEQLTLLEAKFKRPFHEALSVGWSSRKEASAASAEWLLNGKAIAHQSLAEQHILARDAKDPKAKQLFEDLQKTRAQLAAHINRSPKPGLEKEYQKDMQELRTSEQDLAQKLARAVGRPYRSNPWVTLDELRAKLGPKTAFVDIARFPVFDFNINKSIGPRYIAWITPPQGKGVVQLFDLGDADAIDQLVAQTRRALDDTRSIRDLGEPEALAALQKPLRALSAKVLHPLLPTLEKYEEWIVCPDGALWLTPWSALLLPGDEFAVEKYLIRHVVSGRDLVLELTKVKAQSAYIFADPDYDLSPSKVMTAAGLRGIDPSSLLGRHLQGSIGPRKMSFEFRDKEVVIRNEEFKGAVAGTGTWKQQGDVLTIQTSISQFKGTIEANEIRGQRSKRNTDGTTTSEPFRMECPRGSAAETRSIGSLATLPKAKRLPGTAQEAEAIRPKIQQWLRQDPKVFVDARASKVLVRSIQSPRVLTLATHGYFLPTQEVEAKDRPGLDLSDDKRSAPLLDKKGQPIENPLLRCGLLLAGCNERAKAKPGEDDGILTGLEIVGMDLNGCELVVLSACETGLGDVRSGEGVAGLRQAFQLAGAKSVLASLWQVPDTETALLMNAFYGELAKGRSQAQALRTAQLQQIAARRKGYDAAHPFFWAAFALTSRGTD